MSDHDASPPVDQDSSHAPKRRRLHGACDACKKKKGRDLCPIWNRADPCPVKCDSAEQPDNICTNCITGRQACTHDAPKNPKKKDAQQAYIQQLEDRLGRLEKTLGSLQSTDINKDAEGAPTDSPSPDTSHSNHSLYSELKATHSSPPSFDVTSSVGSPENDASEAEDLAHVELTKQLSKMAMSTLGDRWFGQSSNFMFLRLASSVKSQVTGQHHIDRIRRPIYWELEAWESGLTAPVPVYTFPPSDLLHKLVHLYFDRVNIFMPLMHRPTFERSLKRSEHLSNHNFGMTVLLVCAIGARYSHDPRVTLPGDEIGLSSGWQYYNQVQLWRPGLLRVTTIYDLQYYSLATWYLLGTSTVHTAWTTLGLGMRLLIEKGAHRRKGPEIKPSVEEELHKRAFWTLIVYDRLMSCFLGRPTAIQDEDFDVDYPLEVDDEFWETADSDKAFQQPQNKPCQISAFNCTIKLCEILAFTQRTLYSTKKSKLMTGFVGSEWEYRIVSQLDSSMNRWKDSLPKHLAWDPDRPDRILFEQSVQLHALYSYVQIQVHRPFLTKPGVLQFPSHHICTNAARACSHYLEVGVSRGLGMNLIVISAAFASSIVILLNTWGSHKTSTPSEVAQQLALVHKCLALTKSAEKSDLITALASFTDHPPPPPLPKRRRISDAELVADQEMPQILPNPADSSGGQRRHFVNTPSAQHGTHVPLSNKVQGKEGDRMPGGSGSTDVGAATAFSADDSPSRANGSWTTAPLRPPPGPPLPQHQVHPPSTHTPALFPLDSGSTPANRFAPNTSVPMHPMADNDWDLSSMLLVEMGYMSQSDSVPDSMTERMITGGNGSFVMKEGLSFGSTFFGGQTPTTSGLPAVGGVTGGTGGDVRVGSTQSADGQPFAGRMLGGAGRVGQLPDAKMPFRADAPSFAAASASDYDSDPMSLFGQQGFGMTYADALHAMNDTQGPLPNPDVLAMWTDAPAAFGAEDWSEFISQFASHGPGQ